MRRVLIGTLAAAALVASACTSGSSTGSMSSSSSSSASSATPTGSTSTGSTSTAPPVAGSGAVTSGSDTPAAGSSQPGPAAGLDARTTSWFITLCTGLEPFQKILDAAAETNAPADSTAALKVAGKTMTATEATLVKLPPPTFAGGDGFAADAEDTLSSFGEQLATSGNPAYGESVMQGIMPDRSVADSVYALPACHAADFPVDH